MEGSVSKTFEELKELEDRARQSAIMDIEQRYSKPEDLEKLEHDIKRSIKRKEEYDSQLKTAVESQLDGIKTGVSLLRNAESEVKTVDESLRDLSSQLEQTSSLKDKIEMVRLEYQRHTRLTTAINNMSYVFSAPDSIVEINELLKAEDDQNLLRVHKLLHDLEKSRDGLMYELYVSSDGQASESDCNLLLAYFKDVPIIAAALWDRIVCTFSRVLDTAVQNPRLLVTAVRLVDRQQQVDDLWDERRKRSGFAPADRPRRWREKMFDTMRSAIQAKLEGSQALSQSETDHWLEQHFVLLLQFICRDLLVAKKLCSSCFPPDYKVFDFYLAEYHRAVSERVAAFAKQALDGQLHYRDCVALVKWTQTFKVGFDRLGEDTFRDPQFSMEAEYQRLQLKPHFLDEEEFDRLIGHCVGLIGDQVWLWFANILEKEKRAWYEEGADFKPELDLKTNTTYTALVSSVAAILNDLVSEVGRQLPPKAKTQLDAAILDKLVELLKSYSSAVKDFVRSVKAEPDATVAGAKVISMERILVASINNLHRLVQTMSQFLRHDSEGGSVNEALQSRKLSLEQACLEISREWMEFLTGEVIEYLQEPVFKKLYTPAWLQELGSSFSSPEGQTILEAVGETHDNVYKNLFDSLKAMLLTAMSERVCVQMLRSLMQQRPALKEQRLQVASRLTEEAKLLKDGFSKWKCRCDHFEALGGVAELFRMSDLSLAELEINALLRNFPDMRQEQLELILVMRGDCSRTEAKNIVAPSFADEERQRRNPQARRLFSLVGQK